MNVATVRQAEAAAQGLFEAPGCTQPALQQRHVTALHELHAPRVRPANTDRTGLTAVTE